MEWFQNLKVSVKLTVAFLVMVGLVCAQGFVSLGQAGAINAEGSRMATRWVPSMFIVNEERKIFTDAMKGRVHQPGL